MGGDVLVVESERPVRRGIRRALEWRGYRVHESGDAGSALARVAAAPPAAVVLDAGAPAAEPRATLRGIKRVSDIPVLMLARGAQQADSVRDLLGVVDDCLVGPVAEVEVVWGLESLLHRAARYSPAARAHDDGWIALDSLAQTARAGGRPLHLGRTEFTILDALVRNAGSVLAPARLAEIAWFPTGGASVCQVRLCIARIRAELGPSTGGGSPVVTLPGYGYRYIPPARAV